MRAVIQRLGFRGWSAITHRSPFGQTMRCLRLRWRRFDLRVELHS